jgi:signal transduction histidine kinase
MKFCDQNHELRKKVQEMKAILDHAFQAVHNVASNLRPTALDMGLNQALRWLCTEFSRKSGVRCEFQAASANLPQEKTAIVLFRIVQESLTNIARYAQASRVKVTLRCSDAALHVSVKDNGRGFDPSLPPTSTRYGLLGMRERALALGGAVQIRSAPGQGTRVAVTIPVDQAYGQAGGP